MNRLTDQRGSKTQRSELAVLVIDDPPPGRSFAQALSRMGVNVIGVYGYGQHIPGTVWASHADVILVGLRHPIQRALRALRFASLASRQAPVLAFVDHDRAELFEIARQAMQAGARDIFTTSQDHNDLDEIMRKAVHLEDQSRQARTGDIEDVLPPGEVVILFGTKGGVGKTTFAVNLSYAHSTLSDDRVALLDLDTALGGISSLLQMDALESVSSERLEAIAGDTAGADLLSLAPKTYGRLVVSRLGPALLGDGSEPGVEEVTNAVQVLSRIYDYVYVDAPAKWNEQMRAALSLATTVIWVLTPDMGSVVNARAALSSASDIPFLAEKVKIVLNRATLRGGLSREEIEGAIGYPIVWEVPEDTQVAAAARLGQPLVETNPQAKLSRSLLDLLYALAGVRGASQQNWWDRLRVGLRLKKNQDTDSFSAASQRR